MVDWCGRYPVWGKQALEDIGWDNRTGRPSRASKAVLAGGLEIDSVPL